MKFDKNIFNTPTIKFEKGFSQEKKIAEAFQELSDNLILVISGRSNVGKSSFINQLLKDKIAKTSKTPGRTQEINLFSFSYRQQENTIYLFDLPGYGYAKISKETQKKWDKLLSFFFKRLPKDAHVFQLQDAKVPNQKSDQSFLNLIMQVKPQTHLIFNKIDKLKNQKDKNKIKQDILLLQSEYPIIQNIFQTSVPKNLGFDDMREFIYQLSKDYQGY